MSIRSTASTLLLAAAAGALLVAFARPAPAAPQSGLWEYRIVRGAGIDLAAAPKVQDEQMAAAQGLLNSLAGEGWELQLVQGSFAVLRRPR